jgi:osmotically-inducible protein OsmY
MRNLAKVLLTASLAASIACAPTHTRESTGEVVDDSVITAKVKSSLVGDPQTKAHQINVDTYRGTVQLSGFVDSAKARNRALQIARDTNGVKEVKNSLEVRQASVVE